MEYKNGFLFLDVPSMRQLMKSLSWYLYGGVSCYCLQRFFVDFIHVKTNENALFQSGDIVILDIWNRLKLNKNHLIYATSPVNHHQKIFGRVIAFPNESINVQPKAKRVKYVRIPKGSVAIELLTNENSQEIQVLPMGLIEGRPLARIWPLNRYTSRLLNLPSTSDN